MNKSHCVSESCLGFHILMQFPFSYPSKQNRLNNAVLSVEIFVLFIFPNGFVFLFTINCEKTSTNVR